MKETIKNLQEENQHLKDQVKKSYQEGLLQKQFDKDMEIQELKDKIEFLTTFKEVISEHKPAFCKLAGRDCEWLGKEKQLAISELELVLNNFKNRPAYFDVARQELCLSDQDKQFIDFINNRIKSLKGEK